MRDLEAPEFAEISFVRDKFMETARLFNFKVMEPSPLELLSTLEAKSGPAILNEVYSFKDKGEREVALRFDLTIGLTRHVALRRDLKMPTKIACFAGVWRYDEPQAGRYRYFHQWDIEIYGPFSQESDAEVLQFVASFFRRLGLQVSIEVNDRQLLEEYIKSSLEVSDNAMIMELFRAVDKVPKKGVNAVMQEYANRIDPEKLKKLLDLSSVRGTLDYVAANADVVGLAAWQRISSLMESLAARRVENAFVNLGIVRGLDYYSGMVFEAFDLASPSGALVGGGRYDTLTEAFGRKDIGATGVAGGVERIIMALRRQGILGASLPDLVYVAYAGEGQRTKVLELSSALRDAGFAIEHDLMGKSLRKQLEDAAGKNSAVTIILGPEEVAGGTVLLKHMAEGREERCPIDRLSQSLTRILRSGS